MLKTANFTPWREDWLELLEYVDVIKMHGRESIGRLSETMDIIKRFAAGDEILFSGFEEYLEETNLVEKPIQAWRRKIKNCKFDCWDCNFCDRIYAAKSDIKSHPLVLAVTKELVDSVNKPIANNSIGLTSDRVRQLLYSLSLHCTKYLEIGCAIGATASAVAQNPNIDMHCIDNWSQQIQPESGEFELPLNDKQEFLRNVGRNNLHIHDADLLSVDRTSIKGVDFMFYDGPHDEATTAQAVEYYAPCLAEHAILIFDDANWDGVVAGANQGIERAGLIPIYSKLVLNSVENSQQWWNGLYILVVKH
jgi:predicted O-methyltransferase YrrM